MTTAMTIAAPRAEETTVEPVSTPTGPRRQWNSWALIAICGLAAALYGWRINSEGWGNPYYAAAVKSMSQSVTNFVFGSFDPVGVVTVDKPPLALWAMVASTAVFGFHRWSVLLPQVIEGVAAVFVLHRTVRRWAGENAALIAALVLALMPITVAINRDSNPDTMMVLLLVLAAYALTRSVEREQASSRWLMLAGFFLGLGFIAKMLQAWIVVPAFLAAYLVGSTASWPRRVLRILGAGGVMLASSMWWVVLVGVWPQPKPYIGGSTDGSVLNLVIGYNGLGRVLGRAAGQAIAGGPAGSPAGGLGGPASPGGLIGPEAIGYRGGFMSGQAGITRLFADQMGGQISWLLPLCVIVLVTASILGIQGLRAGERGNPTRRAGWFLWGGWLLMVFGVLSFMQNQFHPYYTTELAPAISAVVGAGLAPLWHRYRHTGGYSWLLLPAAVATTAGWAWVVISRQPNWYGWLRYAVAVVAVLAVIALLLVRLSNQRGVAVRVASVLVLVALLLAPGVWSAATAFADPAGGAMAQAGPPRAMSSARRRNTPGTNEPQAWSQSQSNGSLTTQQRAILSYAAAHSGDAWIKLAVEGGARTAESYLLNSDATVMGMGGFGGGDPAPTAEQLAQWVQQGQLKFVLEPGHGDQPGRGADWGRGAASAA
ncbi:MAG: glycosyltransferase family 39 protein, partial [Pseudonocardia sp.]|nr:glycosyltransferase family 39 protein [Pseudonocardia sp.]